MSPAIQASMLTQYGAVFCFIGFSILFIAATLAMAWCFRPPSRPEGEKTIPYECGELPVGSAWVKFNIRFYVVAIIFIIFDVEAALMVPWAVVLRHFRNPSLALLEGVFFLVVLGSGLVYLWARGDLDWVKPEDRHDNREIEAWKRRLMEKGVGS